MKKMKKMKKMNKEDFCKKYNLTEDQFYGREFIKGDLNLHTLKRIPEGFNPIVEGYLFLSSLTRIPKGFNPVVGGYLSLSSVTSIPEEFNPVVGGSLYLRLLNSIPEEFNPVVGGNLWLSSVTSIPEEFNPIVGGELSLHSLKSIPEGFNPLCRYIYAKITIPYRKIPGNYIFSWRNGKYLKVDDILLEALSINNNISKCKKLDNNIIYFARDGVLYAFGNTEKEAEEKLKFEICKSIIE